MLTLKLCNIFYARTKYSPPTDLHTMEFVIKTLHRSNYGQLLQRLEARMNCLYVTDENDFNRLIF